jgi:integrase
MTSMQHGHAFGGKPTRMLKTEVAYEQRFQTLVKKYSRKLKVAPEKLDPSHLVSHLLADKSTLSMSSWRQYKAAVLFVLKQRFGHDELTIEILENESSRGLPRTGNQTSSSKKKHIPRESLDAVLAKLLEREQQGYRNARLMRLFAQHTQLVGLRPNEWITAEIERRGTSKLLVVRNSKNSNGRANGESRAMILEELSASEIRGIKETIAAFQLELSSTGLGALDEEHQIKALLQRMRYELRSSIAAVLIQFGEQHGVKKARQMLQGLTPYSWRHQFFADCKLTFDDPVIIAALGGHSSPETAFEHYGKRRNGTAAVRVAPTPESVAAVRKRLDKPEPDKPFDADSENNYLM